VKRAPACLEAVRDCTSWFDGCNTCTVAAGVVGECTLKSSKRYRAMPNRPRSNDE
jgi:hypothetical protein